MRRKSAVPPPLAVSLCARVRGPLTSVMGALKRKNSLPFLLVPTMSGPLLLKILSRCTFARPRLTLVTWRGRDPSDGVWPGAQQNRRMDDARARAMMW